MAVHGPVPGTLSLVLFVVFWSSVVLAVALWVYRDAGSRGSERPSVWALGTVVTAVGVPYYFYRRRGAAFEPRAAPPGTRDRALATWAWAGVGAFLVGALLGPPDPFSQTVYALGALAVVLPVAYLLVYREGYRIAVGGD